MFSQYFGHYLLNRGLINAEELSAALALQHSTHVKFGVLAVDEGLLTSEQVELIHEKQKQMDKRFGEIAIDLGLLNDDQVNQMLTAQKQDHLILAQALVDNGSMTIEGFSNALKEYKEEHSLTDEKFEAIKAGDIDVLVETLLPMEDVEQKEIYTQYLSLFAKNIIRFIDDQVHLEANTVDLSYHAQWLVHQEIVGASPLFTAIAAEEQVFLQLASKYAEEELGEIDELAKASVSEFLNLHNGIFLVNMSNKGVELTMNPQQVGYDVQVDLTEGKAKVITVNTSIGSFHLLLSAEPAKISLNQLVK